MAMNPIAFEVVRDIDGFRALRPEWDDLWRRAEGEYFQTFAFCYSSFQAEDADTRRKLHCVVGRRDGRLVALWPLVTFWNTCWKSATPLGPQNRAPSDILVAPEHDVEEIVKSTWRAALKFSGADVIQLWRIRSTSLLYRYAVHENMVRRASEEPTPFAVLQGQQDWEAFCRSRPGRGKSQPSYLRRRLSARGEVSFDIVDANDKRRLSLVDWFVVHKREWAHHKELNSRWVFSESSRRFWNALLSNGSDEAGGFRLCVLTLNDEPLAVSIMATGAGRVYLLAITYDLKHARLSPGTVLVDDCVKWAFDNGLDFDFGPGDQQYKSSWSSGFSYMTTSFLVLPTRWGRAGFAAKQAAKRLPFIAARIAGKRPPEQFPAETTSK
ncbi:Acetyltransferase (GNAT) domain protein [Caballeronia sp. SBC1]|uniref:GNAT family N-acetyltransferase n=1 Tax=Caballeronia sp. SBC1 TaxID=2705548 RepID=UPI00140C7B87|nr:GNAT family N-acetyltransferase [Caballeronia sp. SBC1]QIN62829.1 Acetyltransferase (GNAT) domain protein [Caballeronia sp. SBC1]